MNADATITVHHEVEVTKAPRTRRQLREALEAETAARVRAEVEIESNKTAAATEKQENRRLRSDLAGAESALNKIGYERSIERSIAADMGLLAPREQWQPKQGLTPTLTTAEHEKILDQRVGEAIDATRASTLQAVLTALTIKGYERHGYPRINPETFETEQVTLGHDTQRFWADIQTALEVREEKRAADERAATEKKVARLAPAQQLSLFFPSDGLQAAAVKASDILAGGVTLGFDPAFPRVSDLLGDPAPGGSYGAATAVPKPTTPKKPAKKKSSTKGDQK